MNRKFIVAILLVAAMSAYIVYVQAQKPGATKDNAQKVVTIISGDKAKTQTYCEIQKLTQQMEQAEEKNDSKTANELSKKIDRLEDTLGPEYVALMDGLEDLDPEKDKLGAEIMSMFEALDDRLCAK
jgi:predicted  nucleic acid-binding Zn-ribbon protein